ncbi:MAG: glycosyltransferase family 2 protein [Muribaculaceae bacterium]|nr:glycosyltransferase family 2 protein [Muribaculaceae bacterium]
MERKEFSFISSMKCNEDLLIVNQKAANDDSFTIEVAGKEVEIINSTAKGLSNSRNQLLSNASGDICILGDDDLVYRDDYNKHILKAYQDYPDADIIVFRFSEDAITDTRQQFSQPKKLNLLDISKVASVEITFRRESILSSGITFDPLLGLGAPIDFSEENAFLADALRQGLIIRYIPITICHSIPDVSRQKQANGYDKPYFQNKGAAFYRIYGALWPVFAFAFVILKSRSTFSSVNCLKALSWISRGKSIYKSALKSAGL